MQKPFYDDILLVLILTLVIIILLLLPDLSLITLTPPLNYIPYILLLLFLPGYSLLAAVNLEFAETSIKKRLASSVLVSLATSIIIALLLTYTPLEMLNGVIVYILGFFTIILLLSTLLRRKRDHYVHFIEPDGLPHPGREVDDKREINLQFIRDMVLSINKIRSPQPQYTSDQKFSEDPGESLAPYDGDKLKLDGRYRIDSDQDRLSKAEVEERVQAGEGMETQDVSRKGKPDGKPRGSSYLDLVVVLVLTIVCTVFVLDLGLNNSTLNSVMGLLLIVFLPGYALIAAIYPRRGDLSLIIRLVLSFGVSYFLTSVIGFVLNHTHLGNSLNPVLLVLAIITFIVTAAAFWMRIRVPAGDRFRIEWGATTGESFSIGGSRNRNFLMLGVVVIVALLIAAPTALNLLNPTEEVITSTDFYVVGPDGNNISAAYPQNITSGEDVTVTMVLVNHENTETTYRIVTSSNQSVMDEINVTLKPNEKKEIPYTFTAGAQGERKIEFLLYKLPDLNNVYRAFSFLINIVGSGEDPDEDSGGDESADSSDSSVDDSPEPSYQPPAEPNQPEEQVPEPYEPEYPDDGSENFTG